MSPALKMAKTISFPPAESELILTLPRKAAIKHCSGDPLAKIRGRRDNARPEHSLSKRQFHWAELSQ
jgi:hypothetical protein